MLNVTDSSRAGSLPQVLGQAIKAKARKMAVILKQNGGHWPPFSASVLI
jgi:hypothetical protein